MQLQDLILKLAPTDLLYWAMAILAVGVMIPNPLQGTFKSLLGFLKSFIIKDSTKPVEPVDVTIDKLPDLVREITKLLISGGQSRELVLQELLKLLGLATALDDKPNSDTLSSVLKLLTQVHTKSPDIDFSKELAEIWAKVTQTEAPAPKG